MRILICDDDKNFCLKLQDYILQYFSQQSIKRPEISIYNDGESLLNDSGHKDIIFLDVEMPPGLDGITVANELRNTNNKLIVFIITSYTEYLDDAMKFNVFRYLSKPLDKHRLFRNLKDALFVYNSSVSRIAIETKTEVISVYTSDIIYIEAKDRKVYIYTPSQIYLSIHNMNYWEQVLMPFHCFFRSHRSYIVGMDYVSRFDRELISLCNGQYTAYLTRRKYTEFKTSYLLFLESVR
jgi:two-component system LytT family response regulator